MKKNVKLVAGLATTLALVGATGIASGFAWITTNATVSLSYNRMRLTSTSGELKIANIESFNNAKPHWQGDPTADANSTNSIASTTTQAYATGAADVSDVSSVDGLNFFKPVFPDGGGNYTVTATGNASTAGPDYYSIDNVTMDAGYTSVILTLQVTPSTDTTKSMDIVISEANLRLADETSTDTNDANLLGWSRAAVNVYEAKNDDTGNPIVPTIDRVDDTVTSEEATQEKPEFDDTTYGTFVDGGLTKTNTNPIIIVDNPHATENINYTDAADWGMGIAKGVKGKTDETSGKSVVVGSLPAIGQVSMSDTDENENTPDEADGIVTAVTTVKDEYIVEALDTTGAGKETDTVVKLINNVVGSATGETKVYYVIVSMWLEGTNGNQNSAGGGEIALDLSLKAVTHED